MTVTLIARIDRHGDTDELDVNSEEKINKFRQFGQLPDVYERLVKSFGAYCLVNQYFVNSINIYHSSQHSRARRH